MGRKARGQLPAPPKQEYPPGAVPFITLPGYGPFRARHSDGAHVYWSQWADWKEATLTDPTRPGPVRPILETIFAAVDEWADSEAADEAPHFAADDIPQITTELVQAGILAPVYRTAKGTVACYLISDAFGKDQAIMGVPFFLADRWPDDPDHPLTVGTVTEGQGEGADRLAGWQAGRQGP